MAIGFIDHFAPKKRFSSKSMRGALQTRAPQTLKKINKKPKTLHNTWKIWPENMKQTDEQKIKGIRTLGVEVGGGMGSIGTLGACAHARSFPPRTSTLLLQSSFSLYEMQSSSPRTLKKKHKELARCLEPFTTWPWSGRAQPARNRRNIAIKIKLFKNTISCS